MTSDIIQAAIGDQVECRTATGDWFPAVVVGRARNVKYGKSWAPAVAITGGGWTNVNWPIDHVRLAEAITHRSDRSTP